MGAFGRINMANMLPGDDDQRPGPRPPAPTPVVPGRTPTVPGGKGPRVDIGAGGGDSYGGGSGLAPFPTAPPSQGGVAGDAGGNAGGTDPLFGMPVTGGLFNWNPGDLAKDKGYQFRLGESQRALDRRLAQTGNFYSGDALKEHDRLAQGMASDEADRAYGRALGTYTTNAGEMQRLFQNYTGEDQRAIDNDFRSQQQQWTNDFASRNQQFNDWLNLAKLGVDATGKQTDNIAQQLNLSNMSFYDIINAYLASLGQGKAGG